MEIPSQRRSAVTDAVQRIRAIAQAGSTDRAAVARILDVVKQLAARPALWSAADYPGPGPDEATRQARYLISEDEDRGFALYLNVMLPGRRIPPTTTRPGPASPQSRARSIISSTAGSTTVAAPAMRSWR